MLKKVIIDLLNKSVLTNKKEYYYMNYYRGNSYEIKKEIFDKLNNCDLLFWDSGNIEFKEDHYILECSYGLSSNYLLNIKRTLNYIRYRNAAINNYKTYSKEIYDILIELLKLEKRKLLINKIKENINKI